MPSRRTPFVCLTALFLTILVGAPAEAQEPEARRFAKLRWETLPNPTDAGSPELKCMVWYPGHERFSRAIAPAPEGGYPVIVFLHGRGGPAIAYTALGRRLAAEGYVVVLSDTALFEPDVQRDDGIALFAALGEANATEASFWQDNLDMGAVGVAGHSMGGGSAAHVLAENPGYRAGFAFAPWDGGRDFAATGGRIDVPLGIIHGEGDTTLPWRTTGKVLYDALPRGAEKFLYLVNHDMTHQNLAVLLPFAKDATREVFETSATLCAAFFDKHLRGSARELSRRLADKSDEPRLVRLYRPDKAPAKRSGR